MKTLDIKVYILSCVWSQGINPRFHSHSNQICTFAFSSRLLITFWKVIYRHAIENHLFQGKYSFLSIKTKKISFFYKQSLISLHFYFDIVLFCFFFICLFESEKSIQKIHRNYVAVLAAKFFCLFDAQTFYKNIWPIAGISHKAIYFVFKYVIKRFWFMKTKNYKIVGQISENFKMAGLRNDCYSLIHQNKISLISWFLSFFSGVFNAYF